MRSKKFYLLSLVLFLSLLSGRRATSPTESKRPTNTELMQQEPRVASPKQALLTPHRSAYSLVSSPADMPRPQRRYPNEILVRLAPQVTPAALQKEAPWIQEISVLGAQLALLTFDESTYPFADRSAALKSSGLIEDLEPNYALFLAGQNLELSSAPYAAKAPHLAPDEEPENHAACIIDSGIRRSDRVRVGQAINLSSYGTRDDLDDSLQHGSLVYGIVSGLAETQTSSFKEDAPKVCVVKAFENDGYARLSSLLMGLHWASQRTKIIHLSLGLYQDSSFLRDAIASLTAAHTLVVAAVGNDSSASVLYPAAYPGVLAIASHNAQFEKSEFSNWGDRVDYALGGEDVPALREGLDIKTMSGTSAAAAQFTRLALEALHHGQSAEDFLSQARLAKISQHQERGKIPETLNLIAPEDLTQSWQGSAPIAVHITQFQADAELIYGTKTHIHIAWRHPALELQPPFSLLLHTQALQPLVIALPTSETAPAKGQEQHLDLEIDLKALGLSQSQTQALRFELRSPQQTLRGPQTLTLIANPSSVQELKLRQLWSSPLDLSELEGFRKLHLSLQNRSAEEQDQLVLKVFAIPATHEGLARTPRQFLGTYPLTSALAPLAFQELSLTLPQLSSSSGKLSFLVELYQGTTKKDTFIKSYQQRQPHQAFPLYAQKVHRYIVDEAVRLLEKQGVYIKDLMQAESAPQFRGSMNQKNEWPQIGWGDFSLPTGTMESKAYWNQDTVNEVKAFFGLQQLSLLDGAYDADSIDIAFGYSFEDVFDSHFWIVDHNDDDGLDSNGSNHHSALTKIRALLFGGGKLQHGAIDHYRQGHRQAAWWFVGHAAHLLGDLTVPSHVDNENAHGTYGDAYHDWMDSGAYTRWSADHPLIGGKGFVDPFQPRNQGDPVRYLAYSAAQLGNSYAWASTLVGTTFGASGNRIAGGDEPHYDDTMNELFAPMPPRPLLQWHINKDEVKDVWGDCDLVDWVGPTEKRADCKDKDGHTDRDNTDGHGNDDDGDLSRIGDTNFTYGVRAIAGLLYFFAKETGQL